MAKNESKPDPRNDYSYESTDLVLFIWKRKIPLIIITVAAAVISTLVSFTITPLFKSTVVLFPASESPESKSLFQPIFQPRTGILGFGDELQLERILQVLNSDQIRDKIIEKYNLMEHYGIDSTAPFPVTKLFNMYSSNVSLKKTEFNSILVKVMDKDPQTAADIANDIAIYVDSAMNNMKQKRAIEAFELVEQEYLALEARVRAYLDSIRMVNDIGVVDYSSQIERYTEAYGKALAEGKMEGADRIKQEMDKIAEHSATFSYYWSNFSSESGRLRDMRSQYLEARTNAQLKLTNVFILDRAIKAEKKAYPKKSIIVIVATLSTFFLAVISFLFFESFLKKIRS